MSIFRFRRGTKLLARTLKQFDSIVADLDTAAEDIDIQRAQEMDKLDAAKAAVRSYEQQVNATDAELQLAYQRAVQARKNIAALVSA